METIIYQITDPVKDADKIAEAAEILRNGGVVVFPTDTVYAVGASIAQNDAIERLYDIKDRPRDNPISVLVGRDLDAHLVGDFVAPNSVSAARFIEDFWPGPLTLVMPSLEYRVLSILTGGGDKIGVRMPDDPIALALINEVGDPVAAPSANVSGRPSPTTAKDAIEEMNGKVDMILAGPDCKYGIESTIIDVCDDHPLVLRKGPFTREELQSASPKRIYEVPQKDSL